MLYLYCLVMAGHEPPPAGVAGLAGAPVRLVEGPGLGAWVSDHPAGLGAATPELAVAHDAVVRVAMATQTPLPARFGQTFANEEALRRSLAERREGLARALELVRGAVEMTVRVLLRSAPGEAAPRPIARSGRDHMLWLRERQRVESEAQQWAGFLQARVGRAVREVARAEVRAPASASAGSVTISHLVALGSVSRYRLLIREMADREPDMRVMLSGPWAPYSFVELSVV